MYRLFVVIHVQQQLLIVHRKHHRDKVQLKKKGNVFTFNLFVFTFFRKCIIHSMILLKRILK